MSTTRRKGLLSSVNAALDAIERAKNKPKEMLAPWMEKAETAAYSALGISDLVKEHNDVEDELASVLEWITDRVINQRTWDKAVNAQTTEALGQFTALVKRGQMLAEERPGTAESLVLTQRNRAVQQFRIELDRFRIKYLEARSAQLFNGLGHVTTRVDGLDGRVENLSGRVDQLHLAQAPIVAAVLRSPANPKIFCGRDDLTASIVELLVVDGSHHIPLLGPGGIGKTTLAAAVMRDARVKHKFGNQIFFFSCEGVASADGILRGILASMDIEYGPRAVPSMLVALTSRGAYLLVLDNLETAMHSEDRPKVEELLTNLVELPQLSVMITMRGAVAPDGVEWEDVSPIEALGVEASRQLWSKLGCQVDNKLDDLLARLDGLPLAIHLVASRGKLLKQGPARLLEAYDRENDKIMDRGTGERLGSLAVSIRLSLDLPPVKNTPGTMDLLSSLCLLPLGASQDALPAMFPSLEYVDSATAALLDVALASCVNGRIRILAPIRDYILNTFAPEGDCHDDIQRYFMKVASQDYEESLTPEKRACSEEWANVNAVLLYSWGTPHLRETRALVQATVDAASMAYWTYCGDATELLETTLWALGSNTSGGRARCLRALGDTLHKQGHYGPAAEKLEEARAAFAAIGDQLGMAQCTRSLGDILRMQDQYGAAAEKLEEARAAFAAIGDQRGIAQCTQSLGDILYMQVHYGPAAEKLEEARAAFAAIGDPVGIAQCTQSLGNILRMQGHSGEAADKLEEARAAFAAIGDQRGIAQCTQSLGDILYMQDQYGPAAEKLEEARAAFAAIGDQLGIAQCTRSLGDIMRMQDQYGPAAEKLEEARAAFAAIGDQRGIAQCTQSLGNILYMQDHYGPAAEKLEEARAAFAAIGDQRGIAQCTRSLGDIMRMQDQYGAAADKLKEARAAFAAIGDQRGIAQCTQSLGDILYMQDQYGPAAEKLEEARAAFAAIGDSLGEAQCAESLARARKGQRRYSAALAAVEQARTIYIGIELQSDVRDCEQLIESLQVLIQCDEVAESLSMADRDPGH